MTDQRDLANEATPLSAALAIARDEQRSSPNAYWTPYSHGYQAVSTLAARTGQTYEQARADAYLALSGESPSW